MSGYWNKSIDAQQTHGSLQSSESCDVLVVGGGLAGMWAAHDIKTMDPSRDVVILERYFCGLGPSGRSGGIVYNYWNSLHLLRRHLGMDQARRLASFSERAASDIKALPDIDLQEGGVLHVSTASAYDDASASIKAALRDAKQDKRFAEFSSEEVKEKVHSPRFRSGVFYPDVFTVHPAKLVRSLRNKIEALGVRLYECSEVLRTEKEGAGFRSYSAGGDVRSQFVVRSSGADGKSIVPARSYMLVTEQLDDIDHYWPGKEALTDERAAVRYMRKTEDNRIAFGWGFGGKREDAHAREKLEHAWRQFFPHWQDAEIVDFWGGEIDISPTHLPLLEEEEKGYWRMHGYTGNGVGGTRTTGKMIAMHILRRNTLGVQMPRPLLPLPPEPLRSAAASLTREVLLRKEAALEKEEKPRPLTRFLADLPRRFGIQLGR